MSQTAVAIPPGQPIPEPGVEPDGIDSPSLAVFSLISVLLVLATIFFAAGLYFQKQNKLNEARIVAPEYNDAAQTISAQQGILAGYSAPAAEGKPFGIPISLAKELVLKDLTKAQAE